MLCRIVKRFEWLLVRTALNKYSPLTIYYKPWSGISSLDQSEASSSLNGLTVTMSWSYDDKLIQPYCLRFLSPSQGK